MYSLASFMGWVLIYIGKREALILHFSEKVLALCVNISYSAYT